MMTAVQRRHGDDDRDDDSSEIRRSNASGGKFIPSSLDLSLYCRDRDTKSRMMCVRDAGFLLLDSVSLSFFTHSGAYTGGART